MLVTGDHFVPDLLVPVPALVAAAMATRTLRVRSTVQEVCRYRVSGMGRLTRVRGWTARTVSPFCARC